MTHLLPAAEKLLELDDDERIARIRADRWIDYPRAALALTRLSDLLDYPQRARMPSVLIWGESGMGKTMIAEKHLRDHPPAFDAADGVRRTPILSIEMPGLPNPRWLYTELLTALEAPLPRGHQADLAFMAPRTANLMKITGVRMLVIDEIHNILSMPYRAQRAMLNLLRQLTNQLRIPLVCLGTQEAREALLSDPQIVRRFESFELPRWQRGEEFYGLMNTMLQILPLRAPSTLGTKSYDLVLSLTDGITSNIFRLMTELAVQAIRCGDEAIKLDAIKANRILPPRLDAA